MADYEIVELPTQTTAAVRGRVPMAELSAFFERAFHGVWGVLEAQSVAAVGPPFGIYSGPPGETIQVEAGFPVAREIESAGDVVPSELPGGRVVKTLHVGPYDTLAATYEALQRWMTKQGLDPSGAVWECYLSDPSIEADPATWHTEIFWPVA